MAEIKYVTSLVIFLLFSKIQHCHGLTTVNTSTFCPALKHIENAIVTININSYHQNVNTATIKCFDGYDLDGAEAKTKTIFCVNGQWENPLQTSCSKRCPTPPFLQNGALEIEGKKDDNGSYHKGTVATYSCAIGYYLSPRESKYRVCEKGMWTGPFATCLPLVKITGCHEPKDIANGYFAFEKGGVSRGYTVGQRLHYECKTGYVLVGSSVQLCLDDGTWSPKIPPVCSLQIAESSDDYQCSPSPNVPHSNTTVIQGYQSEDYALPSTIVQIHCISKYRNTRAPCQPGKLQCLGGKWVGFLPICVPAHECNSPPTVSYATVYNLNPSSYESTLVNKYPVKTQISYQCLPGYVLQGNGILECSVGGCWLPSEPPICYRASNNYYLEVNSINAVLISAATGAGVLGLLLVICLVTVCRRKKPLSRAISIAPPAQHPDMGDHASLLLHPDRLALIAFADGMQNDQATLPTYDEAIRDRGPGLTASRLHRPHWPNLAGRRARNTPNPDMVHVTRHGSFASHTPSTRSTGDSMGSTDTVAVSEGSTNVTLDTASSHSGSQPASCRVHCGSLASFDTSSVVNTEGVPLLEESELEEIQGGDNISLVVGNPSLSDNASFKLSTASADLP